MKDRKINLDRPQLTGNEIMAGKKFEAIVQNHQFMSKPFYKQTWFFGTTGLASLGLIIGSTLAFQNPPPSEDSMAQYYTTDVPPNQTEENSKIIALNEVNMNTEATEATAATDNSINNQSQNTQTIENTFTPEEQLKSNRKTPDRSVTLAQEKQKTDHQDLPVTQLQPDALPIDEPERNKTMDLYPRIGDKIGGTITRDQLLDNKGITTEGDVNIIHFELHLIDGLGGKIYSEDGNQLNQEMKEALEEVGQGETIYFENIRGQVKNGTEVRLNPLRYVLLN